MDSTKRKATRPGGNPNDTYAKDINATSTAAQRARLLKYLREVGPVTTMQARDVLNIYSAPPRVYELRKLGYKISTVWAWESDYYGRPHRIGRYALMRGGDV